MAIPKTGNVSLKDAYANLYPTQYNVNGNSYNNWNMSQRNLKEITASSGPMALTDLRGRALSLHPNRAGTTNGFNIPGNLRVEVVTALPEHQYVSSGAPSAYGDYYEGIIKGGYGPDPGGHEGPRSALNLNCHFHCDRTATFDVRINAAVAIPTADADAGYWVVCVGYDTGYGSGSSTVLHSQRLQSSGGGQILPFQNFNISYSTISAYPYNLVSIQLINRTNTSSGSWFIGRTSELDLKEQ